jgi:predicted small secreted protein
MKTKRFLVFGLLALGLVLAGCDNGNGGGGDTNGGGGTGGGIQVIVNNLPADATSVELNLKSYTPENWSTDGWHPTDPKKPSISGNSVSDTFRKTDWGTAVAPFITDDILFKATIKITGGTSQSSYESTITTTISESRFILSFPKDFK